MPAQRWESDVAASFPSVPELFLHRVSSTPDAEAFSTPEDGRWRRLTWAQIGERVRALACGLRSLGIEPEQRCAILCSTRLDWIIADLAILCAGGAVTPLYPTAADDELRYILEDASVVAIVVEDEAQAARVRPMLDHLPALQHIILIDGAPADGDDVTTSAADLERRGLQWGADHPDAYRERIAQIAPEHVATVMYTSGTSGQPKGAVLTHDSWVFTAEAMDNLGFLSPADKHFLWLPLSHSFGHVLSIAAIRIGIPTAIDGRVERISDNLQQLRPTFVAAVPRIFERLHAQAVDEARRAGGIRGRAFRWAFDVGAEVSALRQLGQAPTGLLAVRHALAERLVFSRIRARFGGKLRFFISGSAPLSKELAEFFHAAGVLILEGYGLTESSAASTVNRPDRFRFGTVGLPLPGVEVKLSEPDGEVLLRGRGLMRGYHGLPEQTDDVLPGDGWLRTGDIGAIDEDGFLRIVERKKDLIKTSSGKIVAPQKLEGRLKAICPYISQVFVYGNARPYCVALVTLSGEVFGRWAADAGLDHLSADELAQHEHVHALLQPYVDQLNADLARFEAIRAFAVLPEELSADAGELTASMKVRRQVVEARNAATLSAFYSDDGAE